MALNGTISGGNYNIIYSYYMTWSATQNVANNTSTITIKWIYKKNANDPYGAWNKNGSSNVNLNIGGTQSGASRADFDLRSAAIGSTSTLKTYTRMVTHKSDGTLSLSVSGTHNTGLDWKTKSCNGTITLNTIPRSSKPTATGTFQLGNSITINTNRASSSFTHTLRYGWGSVSGTIANNVTTSTTWTIPKSLANNIPNGTSGTLIIYCDTYNGSTKIGTESIYKNVTMPNTAEFNPTINNVTLTEAIANLNSMFGEFIQSRSKINVNVSASGAYSSTIKYYSISINGAIYSQSSFTTELLSKSGNQICNVIVTDSRGRMANKEVIFNVLAYGLPSINTFTVRRCNSDGTVNDEGANALVKASAFIFVLNNKNTKTFKLHYKKQGGTNWTTIVLSNDSYPLNSSQIIKNIDVDYEYVFMLEVTDYFSTTSREIPLSTAFTLMDFNRSGKGIGIGKVSSKDALEINMDVYDKFDTKMNNGLAFYETGGATDPNTTIEELILTNHQNNPSGTSRISYFIKTMFYQEKSQTAVRRQIAYPYTIEGVIYTRYYSSSWSEWKPISANPNITVNGPAVRTGRIIEGKPEYVKRINFGALPNATVKRVATGLTLANITVIDVRAMPRQANGDVNVLPFVHVSNLTSGISIYLRANDNTIVVDSGAYDRSAFSMKVDIYYINN